MKANAKKNPSNKQTVRTLAKSAPGSRFPDSRIFLTVLYLITAAVHYLLSVNSVHMPTVYIDEGLYVNIARSIFFDGRVLYRGQPLSYVYLLYPFALLPLFLLPASVSLYRAIQLYNALLISTSVFPAYLLGKKMGLPRERACLLAALTAVVPEMALSSFLTAESLYYPLMIWQFVLAAVICRDPEPARKKRARFGLGLLTGISFFAKPVCVIFGACFLLTDAVICLIRHERRDMLYSAAAAALTGLTVLGGYAIYHLAYGQASALNLYEKQFSQTTAGSIPIILQSVVWHLFALTVAFGGACVLLPAFFRKNYQEQDRRLMVCTAVGILISVIGVAVTVVPYQFVSDGIRSPVHLRYLMFFAPLITVFTLSPEFRLKKPGTGLKVFLLVCAALTVTEAAAGFINMSAGTYNAPSLNMFYSERIGTVWGILLTLLSAAFTVWVACGSGWKSGYVKGFCTVLAIFFTVNTVLTCTARRTQPPETEQNATRAAEAAAAYDDTVIVTENVFDDYRTFMLDAHMRKTKQSVVMNDMLLNLIGTDGVWHSWTPEWQAPATPGAIEPMADTGTLLFDLDTAKGVEFTESVQTEQYGGYTLAKITRGQPVLKTALGSLVGNVLYSSSQGALLIYDPEIRTRGEVTLTLRARSVSGRNCTVTFTSAGQTFQTEFTTEWQEACLTLPVSSASGDATDSGFFRISFRSSDNLEIDSYRTE